MSTRKKLFEEKFSFKPTPSLYNKSKFQKPIPSQEKEGIQTDIAEVTSEVNPE